MRRTVYIRVRDEDRCAMENKNKLSCEQAKNIDIVTYLANLGYGPARIRNVNYWYLSPLRNEKTPSFKVNTSLNRWYDHGIGKGGNLIDFGVLYHACSVAELLQILSGDFSFQQQSISLAAKVEAASKITIKAEHDLSSPALLRYLAERKISASVASLWCREIHYEVAGKNYFAIGFKNDSSGYELRSPNFKGSSSPKDITAICNGHTAVCVYEGFFDFLSGFSINVRRRINGVADCDFVILNSLALFEKARPFMEQHNRVNLYLDRDIAGQNCSSYARSLSSKYEDASGIYKGFKDLNEWLMRNGSK